MQFNFLKIFMLFIFLYSCSNINTRIIVKGKALNGKAGALIENEDGIYYIQEMDYWPKKYINKNIRVTGELALIQSYPITDTINKLYSQNPGNRLMVINPKYRRVLFYKSQKNK